MATWWWPEQDPDLGRSDLGGSLPRPWTTQGFKDPQLTCSEDQIWVEGGSEHLYL